MRGYNSGMPARKTIKPEAKKWFGIHRLRFVSEEMLASRLYPQDLWWLEISERLLDNNDAHINLLCESGCAEPRFHHLRVPVSFIAKNRDDLDFRANKKKFSLYLSANPRTLFREERGQGNIDFSPFKIPPNGGGSKRANDTKPASRTSPRAFVFIDLENELSKEDASDILTWLSGKAGFAAEGAAFTAKVAPSYKTWTTLFQMHNIEVKRARPGVKDSADAKLIKELTRTIPRLKDGDRICLVGSDGIYSQAADDALADALKKDILFLHFGKRQPKWKPKDARYRFFPIDDPMKWRLP